MLLFPCWRIQSVTGGFSTSRTGGWELIISLHELLNKQASCRWFETPWHPCVCIWVWLRCKHWFKLRPLMLSSYLYHGLAPNRRRAIVYVNIMTSSNGTISALLALCEGNSPVTSEFPSQRASNAGFDVLFDVSLTNPLHKQLEGRWFETPWWLLWRHCNEQNHIWVFKAFFLPHGRFQPTDIMLREWLAKLSIKYSYE